MKYRLDFVTNSSSSSFVLGTVENRMSKQEVYSILRNIYFDYQNLIEDIKAFIEQEKLNIYVVEENGYEYFKSDGDYWNNPEFEILEKQFNFDVSWMMWKKNYAWLDIHDYDDYVTKYGNKAEFFIGSLGDEEDSMYKDDVVGWYCEKLVNNGVCSNCYYSENKEEDKWIKKLCKDCKKEQKKVNKYQSNPFVHMIGSVYIYAEEGQSFPSYVEERLHEISTKSCGHMG